MDRIEQLLLSIETCLLGIDGGRRCDCNEVLERFQRDTFRSALLAAAQTICGCWACREGRGGMEGCDARDVLDILNDPERLATYIAEAPDPEEI